MTLAQGARAPSERRCAYIGASEWRGTRVTLADVPALSPFGRRALAVEAGQGVEEAQRAVLAGLASAPWTDRLGAELRRVCNADESPEALATALRIVRRRVMLALVARDATGKADLAEVVGTMTALAELAVGALVAAHARQLAEVHGVPRSSAGEPQDLLVVGMGKLGGGELNVSSDIDLIFVYDEEGTTQALVPGQPVRSIGNQEFFERLGRRLIAGLDEVTAAGRVFRVDMRLRPNGESGPLVVSTAMLEEYLMIQGRSWERFAWLKGRLVSLPVFASATQFATQAASMESAVRPFVYRKYLDFGAIAALRELHHLIRAETARRRAGQDDREDHIKLGRGGIREIEFLAQTFQVIRGGREADLRSKSTLETLAILGARGVLPASTADRLATSYVFLRNLEHALQYVDDAQTHQVPADAAQRAGIAQLMGAASVEALLAELRAVQECVASSFDAIFVERSGGSETQPLPALLEGGAENGPLLIEHLQGIGFKDPAATAQRVHAVLAGRRMQAANAGARTRFERLVRRALHAAAARPAATDIGADELFARFAQLADVIVGRSTYVALLDEFPQAFERVMRLLAASRWATDYLVRHPILLDELLDDRLALIGVGQEPDWPGWKLAVEAQMAAVEGDTERQMNLLRDAHHAQVFRVLVADLDGRVTVERLADHLSALADATLQLALDGAWRSMTQRHRPAPKFAVVAYGKLGGKELGYASDLDVIFIYDDEHPDAADLYSKLARRLVSWLTTQTASGVLFDIDLRLRPNGNAGLMVSSFEAFTRYQRREGGVGAWLWEHQALTRARCVAGDAPLCARIESEREQVLRQPRAADELAREVIAMRQKMLDGHPNASQLFDIKHDRGGMVDIEFIVQALVLAHAHRYPELVRNLGNIALLRMAGELGLIDAALALRVGDAYRTFRRVQHRLRLNGADRARVAAADVTREIADVLELWSDVFPSPLRPGAER